MSYPTVSVGRTYGLATYPSDTIQNTLIVQAEGAIWVRAASQLSGYSSKTLCQLGFCKAVRAGCLDMHTRCGRKHCNLRRAHCNTTPVSLIVGLLAVDVDSIEVLAVASCDAEVA